MNFIFRLDSGAHVGSGHAMRCLALARGLKARYQSVAFVCKDHIHNYNAQVAKEFKLFEIEGGSQNPVISSTDNYEEWLNEPWDKDLEKTNKVLEGLKDKSVVIVDHYALDERFEEGLKAEKVFVIDDILNRKHKCDFLLDANGNFEEDKYREMCGPETKLLIGPQYALIRETILEGRPEEYEHYETVMKVLSFMGGTDKTGESVKIALAFLNSSLNAELHIVLRDTNETYFDLQEVLEHRGSENKSGGRVTLHNVMPHYDEFIRNVDVFLGAAGSSSWERACLGIPSFVVEAADNQHDVAKTLKRHDMAYVLGKGSTTTSEDWLEVFNNKIQDLESLNKYGKNSYNLCDGKGVERVVDILTSLN